MGKKPVGKMMMLLLLKSTGVFLASSALAFSSSTGAEEANRANPSTVVQRHVTVFIAAESIRRIVVHHLKHAIVKGREGPWME